MTLTSLDTRLLLTTYDRIDEVQAAITDMEVAHDATTNARMRYEIRIMIADAKAKLAELRRQAAGILTMIP